RNSEDRMSSRSACFLALICTLPLAWTARAAGPQASPGPYPDGAAVVEVVPPPAAAEAVHLSPSGYITYKEPGCCEPIGGHGRIMMELYTRTGPTFIAGGGILEDRVATGWLIEGGGRSLFFNAPETKAWTVDLSISYDFNSGRANQNPFI